MSACLDSHGRSWSGMRFRRAMLFVTSNSGVNAAPLEAAEIGRERGATVVAITSVEYSKMVANGRPRLAEMADIVLDNQAPPGDAVLAQRVGPVSIIVGVALVNAILAEASRRLAETSGARYTSAPICPGRMRSIGSLYTATAPEILIFDGRRIWCDRPIGTVNFAIFRDWSRDAG